MILQSSAIAVAHANIALIKYWGKRLPSPSGSGLTPLDPGLNLPAAGSLSVSLAELFTTTYIKFDPELCTDTITLNDKTPHQPTHDKITRHLDRFRRLAGISTFAKVDSHNNFPTASGLASSASGFAALTLAATAALGLKLSPKTLSYYARLGSGSAARSIFGGYVEMITEESYSFESAYATPLYPAEHFPLCCTIAITTDGEKEISSRDGMNQTMATSPYYKAWLEEIPAAITTAKNAIKNKDFHTLAEAAEASALRMHASAIAANPGILYWNGGTIELIHLVRRLRADGLEVFFTIDAGPHVKIFSSPKDQYPLIKAIRDLDYVKDFIPTEVGGVPRIISFDQDGEPKNIDY